MFILFSKALQVLNKYSNNNEIFKHKIFRNKIFTMESTEIQRNASSVLLTWHNKKLNLFYESLGLSSHTDKSYLSGQAVPFEK